MDDKTIFALSIPRVSVHGLVGQGKRALQKRSCKSQMARIGLTKPALGYANGAICVYQHRSKPPVFGVMSIQRFGQLQAAPGVSKRLGITSEVNKKVAKNDVSL